MASQWKEGQCCWQLPAAPRYTLVLLPVDVVAVEGVTAAAAAAAACWLMLLWLCPSPQLWLLLLWLWTLLWHTAMLVLLLLPVMLHPGLITLCLPPPHVCVLSMRLLLVAVCCLSTTLLKLYCCCLTRCHLVGGRPCRVTLGPQISDV